MIHQITIGEKGSNTLRQNGFNVKATAEAAVSDVGGSLSAGVSSDTTSGNSMGHVEMDIRTFIYGGDPPSVDPGNPAAFGTWAATVQEFAMPVRYKLAPLSLLTGLDKISYDIMLKEYTKKALTTVDKEGSLDKMVAGATHAKNAVMKPGSRLEPGQKITSSNREVEMSLKPDGELFIYHTPTDKVLWSSQSGYPTNMDQEVPLCSYYLLYRKDGGFVIHKNCPPLEEGGENVDEILWDLYISRNFCDVLPLEGVLEDTGSFKIYTFDGNTLWSSMSSHKNKKGISFPSVSKSMKTGVVNSQICGGSGSGSKGSTD